MLAELERAERRPCQPQHRQRDEIAGLRRQHRHILDDTEGRRGQPSHARLSLDLVAVGACSLPPNVRSFAESAGKSGFLDSTAGNGVDFRSSGPCAATFCAAQIATRKTSEHLKRMNDAS